MVIDGLAYLLATSTSGQEWVDRYTPGDLEELFSFDERKELERGGAVIQRARSGNSIRFVDMIAAARCVR